MCTSGRRLYVLQKLKDIIIQNWITKQGKKPRLPEEKPLLHVLRADTSRDGPHRRARRPLGKGVRARPAWLQPPRHLSSAWFMQWRSRGGRSCTGARAVLAAVFPRARGRHTSRHGVLGECSAPTRDAGGPRAVPHLGEGRSSRASEREEGWDSAVPILRLPSSQLPSPAGALPPASPYLSSLPASSPH